MKTTLPALVLLSAILGLCIFSARTTERDTLSRRAELRQAEQLLQEEHREEARHTLAESYQRWTQQQRYLRILCTHGLLDEAESLYQQVMAAVSSQTSEELAAEFAALQSQLALLARREQPTLDNIL